MSTIGTRKKDQRGFSLIITAVAFFVMLGMLGLSLDVGRMFILKNELQAYADSAAMAGAAVLDGTAAGVQAAEVIAQNGPNTTYRNRIHFASQNVSNVTTEYRTTFNGTAANYATANAAAAPNSYRFLSVTAAAPLPMYFLPAIGAFNGTWNIASSYTISATAVAGQMATNGGGTNMMPFSPDAHDPVGTNFGFEVGQNYTLKWANGNVTGCAGDAGFNPANEPPNHGYVDLGFGNGQSEVRDAIINSNCPLCPLHVGDNLDNIPGNRANSLDAVSTRSGQDPAQDANYRTYLANPARNNRRIVLAPINDPAQRTIRHGNQVSYEIIGFGAFLLDPQASLDTQLGSGYICATYIGPANLYNGTTAGTSGTQVYSLVLYK